jgi:hypothetical protein
VFGHGGVGPQTVIVTKEQIGNLLVFQRMGDDVVSREGNRRAKPYRARMGRRSAKDIQVHGPALTSNDVGPRVGLQAGHFVTGRSVTTLHGYIAHPLHVVRQVSIPFRHKHPLYERLELRSSFINRSRRHLTTETRYFVVTPSLRLFHPGSETLLYRWNHILATASRQPGMSPVTKSTHYH